MPLALQRLDHIQPHLAAQAGADHRLRACSGCDLAGGDRAGGAGHRQGADIRVSGGVFQVHQGGLGCIGDEAVDAGLRASLSTTRSSSLARRVTTATFTAQARRGVGGIVDRPAIHVARAGRGDDRIFGVVADVDHIVSVR